MKGVPAGERQRVGDHSVDDRHQAGDGEAGHHRVADVLLAHHAAVEEPEAGDRHHQHERDRGQHPSRVAAARRAVGQNRRDCRNGSEFVGFRNCGDGRGAGRCRGRGGLGRRSGRGSGGGSRGGRFGRRGRVLRVGRDRRREADQGGYRQRRCEARENSFQSHCSRTPIGKGKGPRVRARLCPSRRCGYAPPSRGCRRRSCRRRSDRCARPRRSRRRPCRPCPH